MSLMAEQATTKGTRSTSEALIKEIEEQVSAALSEMFRRAVKDRAVIDRKDEREEKSLPSSGLVQDCEFGMILLLGRDWLEKRGAIPADLTEDAVRDVVTNLISDTLKTLLSRKRFDIGGEYGETVFFTGAPYTRNPRAGYAANLDAAMLVLGFLAPALKTYHDELTRIETPIKPGDADWVKNLRDLALYVCKAGINYATACQVRLPAFAGFSCDPKSIESDAERSKPYLHEFDRLFFTWTAAETIHDLLEWEGSLTQIAQGAPASEVEGLRKGIQNLKGVIEEAAVWCKSQFLERFLTLKQVDVGSVVSAIGPLKDAWLTKEQDDLVKPMAEYIQYVYHFSQYAAIRSLWPTQVTIDEVSDLCDRLDLLVSDDILKSNLDSSRQSTLFTTLTRSYRLGKDVPETLTYDDDAYYPLVVRSMSALLTRTMDRLVEHATRSDISDVVVAFRRVLRNHHRNLIARRPADAADKDLWSFADGQPYILYATQRTIFALLAYAAFLEKMDDWDKPESNAALELEVKNALSRAMVDNVFGKAIKEIVSLAMTQATGRRGQADGAVVTLPRADWAGQAIRQWLEELARDFEDEQFADYLTAQAEAFLVEYRWASTAKSPAGDKKLGRQLDVLKSSFETLLTRYALSDSVKPTTDDLLPHMFRDLLDSPAQSVAQWKNERPEWFVAIQTARGLRDLFKSREDQEGKVS